MEEILRTLEVAPPSCSPEGRELVEAAKRAYKCWNAIPRMPMLQIAQDDINYHPRTEFGRQLLEIRSRIVASGASLLGWEDIERVVASGRNRED